jgi:hypothetical protein
MPEIRSIMEYVFEPALVVSQVFEEQDRIAVRFAVGYELEVGSIVLMEVALNYEDSYKRGAADRVADLQFGIRENLRDNPIIFTSVDFSIVSPRRFIPKNQRPIVENLVTGSILTLVNHAAPEYLTMETYHRDVPELGMVKYRNICRILENVGYTTQEDFRGTENGIHYWFLRRNPNV